MKLVLPVEPKPQARPRFGGGHAYEPSAIRTYKTAVGFAARSAMAGVEPMTAPIAVVVKCYRNFKPASRRYGDADNLLKAVLDALNRVVWRDDAQVVRATVEKLQSPTPRLEIEIMPVE